MIERRRIFVYMCGSQKLSVRRLALTSGILLLTLGLFSLATRAKLSKYYPDENFRSSTFKSTKAAENRSDKIVQFEVVESACVPFSIDSGELFFKLHYEPVCQIQTLLHSYPFRAPPV